MKKRNLIMAGCFLFLSFLVFTGCNNEKGNEISQNEYIVHNNIFDQFLIENNIPISYVGGKYYISPKIIASDLIAFLELLRLEKDVIANNISNVNTTRTDTGGPFIRNFVIIENGKINIIKDSSSTRFVFDPTHPDSIYSGNLAGYVELPNIDIVVEMTNLITVSRIYENIMAEIELNNIHKEKILNYFLN